MSVFADIVSNYATQLASLASLTRYYQNQLPQDPDSSFHRKFWIGGGSGTFEQGPLIMGGTALDLFKSLVVRVHWEPADAETTIEATVADDELNILDAMLSQASKPAGCRLITLESISRSEDARPITVEYRFLARYTETVTVT